MSELRPVSFKKGRKFLPRLSVPYVPGRHAKRYWTDEENKILREHYPTKGFPFCASRLENRSKLSIYQQANKLGLKFMQRKGEYVRHDYAALDADIRRLWPDFEKPYRAVSGVKALAKQLGKPHWMITQRLRRLGLTVAAIKEPNWTPAEDALLEHVPRHDPDKASEIFKAHGFHRTATAIMVRCKRVGLSRRYRDTFSARTAAAMLGMDNKTISQLCIEGIIKADRRSSRRLPQQGGSPHSITPKALRQFVIDHLERIDFRRVDKFAIVRLLTTDPTPD